MMVIDEKFKIGDLVYLKTDSDQKQRMVTGYLIRGKDSGLLYELSCGTETKWHHDFEICIEKNVLV